VGISSALRARPATAIHRSHTETICQSQALTITIPTTTAGPTYEGLFEKIWDHHMDRLFCMILKARTSFWPGYRPIRPARSAYAHNSRALTA
jgi:hypothetical protein